MQTIPAMSAEQYESQASRRNSTEQDLWNLLDQVKDPEIPVLSLWDMGILRDIQREGDSVTVTITPTYSGCPAMDVIREDIVNLLKAHGIKQCSVSTKLAPAWTTEWMTEKGRSELRRYGIAAPDDVLEPSGGVTPNASVRCPHCGSHHTKRISEFGSTACKALFQCQNCEEPFDYFKQL